MQMRTESDALGKVEVPIDSYLGSFSVRAKSHFQVSSLRASDFFKIALSQIKASAAEVNCELGFLDERLKKAILTAVQEFQEGRFDKEFDLDVYQAGAGTPYNMCLNEILANRANEILGEPKGSYRPIHPNDQVNMAQSSNDVIPTAIRLATLSSLKEFYPVLEDLIKSFQLKGKAFEKTLKVGRTHLQDAVPITLGQEFEAYAVSLERALKNLKQEAEELQELGIGGTAIGTGINTHPEFAQKMCSRLSERVGVKLFSTQNKIETTHSMSVFHRVSGSLRELATELMRICNDLRMMASGPKAGFFEIHLPEVEPGSSIMPGKVNPSILECLNMICVQVFGLDHAISLASQQGQFELNWYTPLIGWNLLHQIEILTHGCDLLDKKCIQGIEANEVNMKRQLEASTAMATALNPYLGYHEVAELVKKHLQAGEESSFKNLVQKGQQKYLDPEFLTKPNRNS